MTEMHHAGRPFEHYLSVLGVARRPPSLTALREIATAHLTRIPFENISKLYRRHDRAMHGIPPLDVFLDGMERHHFGGTCYSNNYHLHRLLVHLGYDAVLCGADMSRPNVHVVNVVTIEGRRHLVDVGYGAPFLAPLPLDLGTDYELAWGDLRYVLKPAAGDGRSRLDVLHAGGVVHGYAVNPQPRRIEDFGAAVAHSFTDQATFMHALLLVRFFRDRSVRLHNLALSKAGPGLVSITRTVRRAQLPDVIEEEFGIAPDISRRALEGVELDREA